MPLLHEPHAHRRTDPEQASTNRRCRPPCPLLVILEPMPVVFSFGRWGRRRLGIWRWWRYRLDWFGCLHRWLRLWGVAFSDSLQQPFAGAKRGNTHLFEVCVGEGFKDIGVDCLLDEQINQ